MTHGPTVAEIVAYPYPVVPLWPMAGAALGFGQHSTYAAAKAGTFPVPVLRRGRRLVVLRSALLGELGLAEHPATPDPPEPPPRLHAVA